MVNESNNKELAGTMEFLFQYDKGVSYNYSTVTSSSNLSFCISDTYNLTSDILVDYSYGGNSYEYSLLNFNLTSTTQTINLYVTTGTTLITLTVKDENDDPVKDAYIYIKKFDVGDNEYKTIEIVKTDVDGEALGNVVLNTDWYTFEIYYDGILKYSEDKRKLSDTSYTFRITLGVVPEFIAQKIASLDIDLYANDYDNTFSLNWTDIQNVISNISLEIIHTNTTGDLLIYYYSNTTNTGQTKYNLPTPYNDSGMYLGNVYGISIDDSEKYFIKGVSLDIREEWDVFGDESTLMAFLFVGTMTCIGIVASAELAVVLTIFGMLIFFWMGFYRIALAGLISLFVTLIIIMIRIRRKM